MEIETYLKLDEVKDELKSLRVKYIRVGRELIEVEYHLNTLYSQRLDALEREDHKLVADLIDVEKGFSAQISRLLEQQKLFNVRYCDFKAIEFMLESKGQEG